MPIARAFQLDSELELLATAGRIGGADSNPDHFYAATCNRSASNMLSMSPLLLGALLLALLLGLAAALVWQEAQQRAVTSQLTYVLEDAVEFVARQLADSRQMTTEDIRRVLEWEVVYLQGLSPRHARKLEPVRVGNSDDAARFILEQTHGRYSEEEVRWVLSGEAAYLVSIGAVGSAVEREG